jgi:CRISPR system Cascade subunit CasC
MNQRPGDMVQAHLLTAFPATLLNRDDAGLAKRMPFGGHSRTRVSSQCLKKHWRDSSEVYELGDLAVRSTRIYERLVAQPLVANHGASEEEAVAIAQWLMNQTVDTKAVDKQSGLEAAQSGQLLVLSRAETEFLAEKAVQVLESLRAMDVTATTQKEVKNHAGPDLKADPELRKALKKLPASLDTALFGRMVTSDLFARVDAAVSVAHAFTTHAEASETDYFTAVDTLKGEADDAGAGLIQDTELTSGVFYQYAVIDMNQLRDNLVGHDGSLADRLAANLVRAMATVSPGAKRGSTAPYSYAEFVLLERGESQPRTLANAFLDPVKENGAGAMRGSVRALVEHRARLEEMYGSGDLRAAVSTIHSGVVDGFASVPFQEAVQDIFGSE